MSSSLRDDDLGTRQLRGLEGVVKLTALARQLLVGSSKVKRALERFNSGKASRLGVWYGNGRRGRAAGGSLAITQPSDGLSTWIDVHIHGISLGCLGSIRNRLGFQSGLGLPSSGGHLG